MSRWTTRLYWALPYLAKCWAASWASRRWDRQRHGAAFQRWLATLAEHDSWSPQQLEDHQCSRLQALVRHAAAHVPYYRELFAEAGVDPESVRDPEQLRRLPVLDKATLRRHGHRLVDERLDAGALVAVHTSGTTGSPLRLLCDVEANSARYAFMQARCHAAAGVARRRDPSVSLGGHLVASPQRNRPPFWVLNRRWRQLYMSSYHLSPANLGCYVDALRRFSGTYIEGYPSSVAALARHVVEEGEGTVSFTACFTTAETLLEDQRKVIEEAFGCPTYDQYGCAEMVVFAAECAEHSLHLSPEMGVVEVLDDDGRPVAPGERGRLVCTGLVNHAQPLIRYRLGDEGAVARNGCACGSPLPVLERIEGRTDAVLVTRDGRRIGRLDPVLKGVEGVAEAQVVQEELERFRVRVVPAAGFGDADAAMIRRNLAARLGGSPRIDVEQVERIERTRGGKFRAVVCNLPKHERERTGAQRCGSG